MLQRALYIIKPEGMPNMTEIHDMMLQAGVRVAASKIVILNKLVLDVIYPNLTTDLYEATMRFLTNAPSEIGIAEGVNVIETLRQLVGENTNPSECRPGTIRHRFGIRRGIAIGSSVYYLNVFHRSKTPAEAKRELKVYDIISAMPLQRCE